MFPRLTFPGEDAADQAAALEALAVRDLHVHTPYCRHASGVMEDYVRAALDRGLTEIGFLEHVEAGIIHPRRFWLLAEELDEYWAEGNRLRERFAGRITVSLGIELGINPERTPELKALSARHPWARIGLSCHCLPDGDGHLSLTGRDSLARLAELDPFATALSYYRALRENIAVFRPDMLCHLDVIRRYLGAEDHRPEVRSLILGVLAEMRRCGAALEINTSGLNHGLDTPYPAPWIVAEAVAAGVGLVICSDSHAPEEVGRRRRAAVAYVAAALGAAADKDCEGE
ncbi:MAG: histidinol-phosphatase [Thermodesulfobacteriota bacterium]